MYAHPQIKRTPLGVFLASTLNDKKVIVMTIVSVIIDTTLSRLGEFSRYFRYNSICSQQKMIINEYPIFNDKKVIVMTQLSVIRDTTLSK